ATKKEWVGPKSVSLDLPELPTANLTPRPIKFDIRLQSVPGPAGYPLANVPWKIVRSTAKPRGMALVAEDSVLLQGRTDAEGKIKMTDADQELVADAYCQSPRNIWLMYPGQAARISVVEEGDDMNEEQKAVNAMSAAGFSPDVRTYVSNTHVLGEMEYAMESLGEISDSGIVKKLDE